MWSVKNADTAGKDRNTFELQSKFFQVATDVARIRQVAAQLPMAEASLHNIQAALSQRQRRGPKP
jgi:hypothetical protein